MTETTDTLAAGDEPRDRHTYVERLLGGDWRSAAYVAVPTLLVAFALGLLTSTYLLWVGTEDTDSSGLGHSAAGFIHVSVANVAMAFGSPTFVRGTSGGDSGTYGAGIAPLTVSLLVLGVFALLLRTYLPAGDTASRALAAARAAVVTSVGLALLSIGAYDTHKLDDATLHVSVSPGRVFGWSVLVFLVVGVATAVDWQRSLDSWRLPAQGALVAVGTGIALAWLTALGIVLTEADGGRLDVLKAMPILLAYLVNIGLDVFHASMGATLHASFSGPDGGGGSLSLFDRQGLSAWYLFLLLIPPAAIGAGVAWMRRANRGAAPEHLARSCYRMALPAVALYLALALPSRFGVTYGGTDGPDQTAHAGPEILYGALILLGWFVVLGFIFGRLVTRSAPEAPGGVLLAPASPLRSRRRPTAEVVALLAATVAVAVSGGGVATASDGQHAGDLGALGSFFLFGSFAVADTGGSESEGATVEQFDAPSPPPGFSAEEILSSYAVAEEDYYTIHGTYTRDPSELIVMSGIGPDVQIVRADDSSYCLQAVSDIGEPFTYDSEVGVVTDGLTC